jgi:hypothetical protein
MASLRFPFVRWPAPPSSAFPGLAWHQRPLIPVVLRSGSASTRVLALVDSGADNTIFNVQVATVLGIDLKSAPTDSFCGTSSRVQVARYCPVTLGVSGVSFRAMVGFTRLPLGVAGILGQVGFFDHFVVTLDQRRGVVALREC